MLLKSILVTNVGDMGHGRFGHQDSLDISLIQELDTTHPSHPFQVTDIDNLYRMTHTVWVITNELLPFVIVACIFAL